MPIRPVVADQGVCSGKNLPACTAIVVAAAEQFLASLVVSSIGHVAVQMLFEPVILVCLVDRVHSNRGRHLLAIAGWVNAVMDIFLLDVVPIIHLSQQDFPSLTSKLLDQRAIVAVDHFDSVCRAMVG